MFSLLNKNKENKMSKWNTELRVNLDEFHKKEIELYYSKIIEHPKDKRKKILSEIKLNSESKEYIKNLYESGYGLKVLARELNLTYSRFRILYMVYLELPIRTGTKVTTDICNKFKSDRVIGDLNPWFDWPNLKKDMHKTTSRSKRGYYTKLDGTKIYLRSTYEYIYAKWLDKNKIEWKYEFTQYELKNGETYRPDFFIFENSILTKIVELNGFYNNRRYKPEMFKEEYDIPLIIIDDVSCYCNSYNKEKKEWSKICELKE